MTALLSWLLNQNGGTNRSGVRFFIAFVARVFASRATRLSRLSPRSKKRPLKRASVKRVHKIEMHFTFYPSIR